MGREACFQEACKKMSLGVCQGGFLRKKDWNANKKRPGPALKNKYQEFDSAQLALVGHLLSVRACVTIYEAFNVACVPTILWNQW